jgi:hypothetical protein
MLTGVPHNKVLSVWPLASRLLKKSIEISGGRLSHITVLDALLNREMQLWLAPEGAMVTQIVTYPTGLKVVSLLLVGGTMRKWLHLLPQIEEWAKSKGCEVSEMSRGRKGWIKMLKDYNSMVFMEKRL